MEAATTSRYEIMFLMEPEEAKAKDAFQAVKTQLNEFGARVLKEEDLGIKRTAYKIRKQGQAHYFLLQTDVDPGQMPEFDRFIRMNESIFKYQALKIDPRISTNMSK